MLSILQMACSMQRNINICLTRLHALCYTLWVVRGQGSWIRTIEVLQKCNETLPRNCSRHDATTNPIFPVKMKRENVSAADQQGRSLTYIDNLFLNFFKSNVQEGDLSPQGRKRLCADSLNQNYLIILNCLSDLCVIASRISNMGKDLWCKETIKTQSYILPG